MLDFSVPERINQERERQRQVFSNGYGVFSLTTDPTNLVMWGHYADCHRGICVGFSTQVLKEFMESTDIPFDLMRVDYSENYPIVHMFTDKYEPGMWAITFIKTKSIHWSYEDEYRIVIGVKGSSPRQFTIPNEAIVEVIIGSKASNETIKEITQHCNQRKNSIEVIQAKIQDDRFGLDFNKLKG